jgi:hypothetical protein
MIDYTLILSANYSTSKWALNGDSYDGLTWLSDTPKPTQSELDALWESTQDSYAKNSCKTKAKKLLADSDWSVLPDVGLANSADFVTYRGILRGLVLNPAVNPEFPTEPTPVWQ